MDETQFDIIIKRLDQQDKKLDQAEQAVSRIDRDMADDRKNFDQMILSQSEIKESNKVIIGLFARLQTKTKETIQDTVSETTQPLKETMDEFVDKKVVKIKQVGVEKLTLASKLRKLILKWKTS